MQDAFSLAASVSPGLQGGPAITAAPIPTVDSELFGRNQSPVSAVDLARLDGLNHAANALMRIVTPPVALFSLLETAIRRTEKACGRRVICKDGAATGVWFTFEALGTGYLKIMRPTKVRQLSERIGVAILAADHLNPIPCGDHNPIALGLRQLADAIEDRDFPPDR